MFTIFTRMLLTFAIVVSPMGMLTDFSIAASTRPVYLVDAGDTLQFDFLDDEEVPVQLSVSTEGYIQLPLLGSLKVSGLTIDQAFAETKRQYIERALFVDPKIALSVLTFRPIFVLGDVKTPGSVAFHPFITADQAIGLAGGPLTALNSAEDRAMTRSRLQGELYVNSADLAKSALLAARYAAQSAGRTKIESDDIPQAARALVDEGVAEKLKAGEERALEAEAAAFASESALIDESIAEAERQIGILEELVANQKKSIKFSEDALKRTNDLLKKGLKTAADLEEIQRQLTSDESRLLSTLSEISQAKRSVSGLKRDRNELNSSRAKDALRLQLEQAAAIDRLIAARKGVEEQLLLVANISLEETRQLKTVVINYKVRRRGLDVLKETAADGQTEIYPGDILVVAISRVGQPLGGTPAPSPNSVPSTTQ